MTGHLPAPSLQQPRRLKMSEYADYINELNNPYNNGVDAYYDGTDCPYDEGTPEWAMWCDGWDAAEGGD